MTVLSFNSISQCQSIVSHNGRWAIDLEFWEISKVEFRLLLSGPERGDCTWKSEEVFRPYLALTTKVTHVVRWITNVKSSSRGVSRRRTILSKGNDSECQTISVHWKGQRWGFPIEREHTDSDHWSVSHNYLRGLLSVRLAFKQFHFVALQRRTWREFLVTRMTSFDSLHQVWTNFNKALGRQCVRTVRSQTTNGRPEVPLMPSSFCIIHDVPFQGSNCHTFVSRLMSRGVENKSSSITFHCFCIVDLDGGITFKSNQNQMCVFDMFRSREGTVSAARTEYVKPS
jgi:hypothetical protein